MTRSAWGVEGLALHMDSTGSRPTVVAGRVVYTCAPAAASAVSPLIEVIVSEAGRKGSSSSRGIKLSQQNMSSGELEDNISESVSRSTEDSYPKSMSGGSLQDSALIQTQLFRNGSSTVSFSEPELKAGLERRGSMASLEFTIRREGWLIKNHHGGPFANNQKRRWFLSDGFHVEYFKDEARTKRKGRFDLRNVVGLAASTEATRGLDIKLSESKSGSRPPSPSASAPSPVLPLPLPLTPPLVPSLSLSLSLSLTQPLPRRVHQDHHRLLRERRASRGQRVEHALGVCRQGGAPARVGAPPAQRAARAPPRPDLLGPGRVHLLGAPGAPAHHADRPHPHAARTAAGSQGRPASMWPQHLRVLLVEHWPC